MVHNISSLPKQLRNIIYSITTVVLLRVRVKRVWMGVGKHVIREIKAK